MTTLYLCKLDPNVAGEPKFIAVLGRIVEVPGGYRFLSNVSAHQSSRKVWPTANSCIPKWTEKCGFTALLERHEFQQPVAA